MLTKEQYLLTVVMEECAEVAQRASKAIRFGLQEKQPGQPFTNAQRLVNEVIDLYETLDVLFEDGSISMPDGEEFEVQRASRREKMTRYMERAQREGVLL
jgi:hypothetical protein